jgi:transposase
MKIAQYNTDVTDAQWEIIQPMLPAAKRRGRPRTDLRRVVNAILYIVKAGCPWSLLPHDFPKYKTVFHIFRAWVRENLWERLNARLRAMVRGSVGKRSRPTAAILDSQSVKSDGHGGVRGYDAAKNIKGRKRHLLVDTLGLVLGVKVTAADVPEREGAMALLSGILGWLLWLRLIWVDGGYTGDPFAHWVMEFRSKLKVEVVKRSDTTRGFKVLARRWVVERTFGWLMRHRRLVRDYETCTKSAEAFVFIALIRIQLRRLA